jgi:hypothetical protein
MDPDAAGTPTKLIVGDVAAPSPLVSPPIVSSVQLVNTTGADAVPAAER